MMEMQTIAPSVRPPSLEHNHHGALPMRSIILIVVPTMAFLMFVIAILLLLVFRKAKWKKNDSISSTSSFRNSSIDDKQRISKYTTSFNSESNIDSPDARNCIYGGKLVCAPQTRNHGGQVFTYRELQVATNGFSEANVIGNGGFGVVYRGILIDGTVAAIKMLHRNGKQGEREFRTEVDLLSRLHSQNLVGLLGYCADEQHRLLVFELMYNGNLQQHLHPSSNNHQHQPLDWWTRLRIALDCARGLEFLHERADPAVIHRDFKCSNVLLDQNFRAKVSDFGMAKTASNKANGLVQTRVFGTTGYVAPEYASTGKLTTKSDVYSYGVVLLELLTGRVPVDITRPPGEHVLVSWALPMLTSREKVAGMVDPALKGKYSKKDLIQIAAITAMCIQSEADYRPLITDVVQSLIPLIKTPSSTTPNRSGALDHISIQVS